MGKKSRGRQQAPKKSKKSKSKNPAKAAREEAEAARRAAEKPASNTSAFGNPGAGDAGGDIDTSQLPPEMQKLLGKGR